MVGGAGLAEGGKCSWRRILRATLANLTRAASPTEVKSAGMEVPKWHSQIRDNLWTMGVRSRTRSSGVEDAAIASEREWTRRLGEGLAMLDADRESPERDTRTESNEPKCCGKVTQAEEREGEAVTETHTEASRGQDQKKSRSDLRVKNWNAVDRKAARVTRRRAGGARVQWTEMQRTEMKRRCQTDKGKREAGR